MESGRLASFSAALTAMRKYADVTVAPETLSTPVVLFSIIAALMISIAFPPSSGVSGQPITVMSAIFPPSIFTVTFRLP